MERNVPRIHHVVCSCLNDEDRVVVFLFGSHRKNSWCPPRRMDHIGSSLNEKGRSVAFYILRRGYRWTNSGCLLRKRHLHFLRIYHSLVGHHHRACTIDRQSDGRRCRPYMRFWLLGEDQDQKNGLSSSPGFNAVFVILTCRSKLLDARLPSADVSTKALPSSTPDDLAVAVTSVNSAFARNCAALSPVEVAFSAG